ncbi:MAG: fused MFS/spermidine synthase [Planctomycetota bacterium]|nr:fused MFS/spermidine synthase [Planctomycetota bacterium]
MPRSQQPAHPRAPARTGTASLLFVLSGATALTYEVLWFRRFAHAWGNSSLAMAAVVSAFLLGLGLGAHLGGRRADRSPAPLKAYAMCEAAVALLALCVPAAIAALSSLESSLHPILAPSPGLQALVRLFLACCVLAPPCAFMGATLPLLIAEFTNRHRNPGAAHGRPTRLIKTTGWLYATNTLGAAAGCYLAGFHLLPALGLATTGYLAVAVNLAVALGALALASSRPRLESAASPQLQDQAAPQPSDHGAQTGLDSPARLLPLGALLAGAAALILQLAWARQLALVLGSSTYAFSAVLLVVLIGIGLGGWAVRGLFRSGHSPTPTLVAIVIGTVLSAVIGQRLLPDLCGLLGGVRHLRNDPLVNGLVSVGASAVLELLPALGAGLLFPALVHLARPRPGAEGRAVGRVYAWNTVGTTLGAALTYILLVPRLGLEGTVEAALFLYLILPWLLLSPARWTAHPRSLAATVLLLTALPIILPGHDPRDTNSGQFLYGFQPEEARRSHELLFFEEGPACNVMVTREGQEVSLRVNGKVDASNFHSDMATQLGIAFAAGLLRPQARRALVIGYGSGVSPGAALLFPRTEVTCVEIEPAVYAASEHFTFVNHDPFASESFTALVDDGRGHIQGTDSDYDLILTEPSNPWIVGVSNLYTTEFYAAVKERLSRGGLLAQWIHTYSMGLDEYRMVVRTLTDAFPHVLLFRVSRSDTFLLAADEPILPGKRELESAQWIIDSTPELAQDMQRYFSTRDVRSFFLRHLPLSPEALRALATEDGPLHTDTNMHLEFSAPLHLFQAERLAGELVDGQLLASATGAWYRELSAKLECGPQQLEALRALRTLYLKAGRTDIAAALVASALLLAPDDPQLRADQLYLAPPTDPAVYAASLASLVADSELEANRLAVVLGQVNEWERALAVLTALEERHPASATVWTNRAIALHGLGRTQQAFGALERALELDPLNESAIQTVAQLRAALAR